MIFLGLLAVALGAPSEPSGSGFDAQMLHRIMDQGERNFYFGEEDPSDYEVADINHYPADEETNGERMVSFESHGQEFHLTLRPNKRLMAPQGVVVKRTVNKNGSTKALEHISDPGASCHFLHKDETSVAALSLCSGQDVHGLVFSADSSLEILPLSPRLKRMLRLPGDNITDTGNKTKGTRESKALQFDKRNLHLVKRNAMKESFLDEKILKRADPHTKEIPHGIQAASSNPGIARGSLNPVRNLFCVRICSLQNLFIQKALLHCIALHQVQVPLVKLQS